MDNTLPRDRTAAEDEESPQPAVAEVSEIADLVKPPLSHSTALTGLFILAVFYTLYFARDLIMPIVLAMLLNLLLSPVVRAMERVHIPEALSAALVILTLVGGAGFGIYELAGPAADWLHKAPESLVQIQTKLRTLKKPMEQVQRAAEQVQNIATSPGDRRTPNVVVQGPGLLNTLLSGTQKFLASFVLVVVLVYFLLAAGDMFLRKLVKVLPQFSDKKRAVEIAHRVESDISRYLFTVTVINAGLGTTTAVALYLLGMPNVLLWGVMVALLNFIPYLGAGINLVVLTMAAILTFDDLGHALLVPATFLTLTTLEGQFITPYIVGRRLTLNPVVILIGLILWYWIWGIPGAILAVPILAVTKVLCDSFETLAPVGEFLGH